MTGERFNKKKRSYEDDQQSEETVKSSKSHEEEDAKTKAEDTEIINEAEESLTPTSSNEKMENNQQAVLPGTTIPQPETGYEYLFHVIGENKLQNGRLIDEQSVAIMKDLINLANQINEMTNAKTPLILKESLKAMTIYQPGSEAIQNKIEYDVMIDSGKYFVFHPAILRAKSLSGKANGPRLVVHPIQDLESGQFGTVKIYSKASEDEALTKRIITEKTLLGKTGQLLGYIHDYASDCIYIIKSYVPGNNLENVKNKLSAEEKIEIANKVIDAVISFHQQYKFLHCDLNLNNFVFDKITGNVTLIDYDVSLEINPEEHVAKTMELRGTPGYIAPELLMSAPPYVFNEKTEVYALGVILKEWLNLEEIIENKDTPSLLSQSSFFSNQPLIKNTELLPLVSLVKAMLEENPDMRPQLSDVKAQLAPFLKSASNNLSSQL